MGLVIKLKSKPPPDGSAFELLLALANDLDKDSSPDAVGDVLRPLAEAALAPVPKDKVLTTVHERTGARMIALKQQLAGYVMELSGEPSDPALSVARAVFVNKFKNGAHIMHVADGGYWRYNSRCWEPMADDVINNLLFVEAMASKIAASKVASIIGRAKKLFGYTVGVDTEPMGFDADVLPVVNCANGEVWRDKLGKLDLRPHRPESRLTSCLPFAFDPTAKCPVFDSALLEIFSKADDPPDMVRHCNEAMGYGITPWRGIACFWLLIGDGNDGKSKLLQTWQLLLAPNAVFNTKIDRFQRDSFNMAELQGKLLLIDDDLKKGTHLDDGLLKTISEQKALTARHAHARSFNFRCLALPIMAGNDFPTTSDNSHGFRRRAMVIPFKRKFSQVEADSDLFPNIWKTELPGILNRALEGWARVRERGHFVPPADCVVAAKEFLAHANPLAAFLADECVLDQNGKIRLLDLRNRMGKWTSEQGLKKPGPQNTLKRELEGLGYEVRLSQGYNRVRGLRLRSNEADSSD
jgi:putative DNA primase/helicase